MFDRFFVGIYRLSIHHFSETFGAIVVQAQHTIVVPNQRILSVPIERFGNAGRKKAESESTRKIDDTMMFSTHPLGALIDASPTTDDFTANPIARFQHTNRVSVSVELFGGVQAGKTCSDNDDVGDTGWFVSNENDQNESEQRKECKKK
jgi:hypothetical protein